MVFCFGRPSKWIYPPKLQIKKYRSNIFKEKEIQVFVLSLSLLSSIWLWACHLISPFAMGSSFCMLVYYRLLSITLFPSINSTLSFLWEHTSSLLWAPTVWVMLVSCLSSRYRHVAQVWPIRLFHALCPQWLAQEWTRDRDLDNEIQCQDWI